MKPCVVIILPKAEPKSPLLLEASRKFEAGIMLDGFNKQLSIPTYDEWIGLNAPITGGEGETMTAKTARNEPSSALDGYLPFRDVVRLSSTRFRHDNMLRFLRLVSPTDYEHSEDCLLHIRVLPPWRLVGWSDRIDARLMRGREGQVGIMFWHPEHGEVWEHHPLIDDDERANALFVSR